MDADERGPPDIEQLRALAQAVIDARQRFGRFETHIGVVDAADEALSAFLMNDLDAPDILALATLWLETKGSA